MGRRRLYRESGYRTGKVAVAFLLQMIEDLGTLSKACLKPSFGEGFKNSKNSPEKGVPLSSCRSNFSRRRKGGTPFSGEFWESLEPSPKEGSKRGLGRRPKVFAYL